MLEILFLSWFVRRLAAIAKGKGRSGWWGALGFGLWLSGEIAGFIVGTVAELGAGSYGLAIVFAIVGAIISYAVVKSLSGLEVPQEWAPPPYGMQPQMPMQPLAPQDMQNPYRPPQS